METALKTFFSSPRFAVAGASSDPSKFGHKLFAWYLTAHLPVTPMNPSTPSIEVQKYSRPFATVASPSALGDEASLTSLSIVTPPSVTRRILEEAKKAGINAVWLQPGSFDKEGLDYARKEWPDAAIGGTDVAGTRGGEGWCILVDGLQGMKLAGRKGDPDANSKL